MAEPADTAGSGDTVRPVDATPARPEGHTPGRPAGDADAPGRPVLLTPAPPGLWRILLGAGTTILAPFFGFLVGSIQIAGGKDTTPLYYGLFVGVVIGAASLVVALTGVRRMYVDRAAARNGHQAESTTA